MFTGIVEELGAVAERSPAGKGDRFVFDAPLTIRGTKVGDSISVNGCCLTVTDLDQDKGRWSATAVAETLTRTNLEGAHPGDRVNLERAVTLEARLGGHLVQGHVDGVGEILSPAPDLHIKAPDHLRRYVVEKGSVTVDGCSLTVVKPTDEGFTAAVIPHTSEVTTLGTRRAGDLVNLEVDMIAKYVERLLAAGAGSPYVGGPADQTDEGPDQ